MLFHHELYLLLGEPTISEHSNAGHDVRPVSRNFDTLELVEQHLPHLFDSEGHCLDIFQELFFEFCIVSYYLNNVGAVNWAVRPRLSHDSTKCTLDVLCELLVSEVDNMTRPNTFSIQAKVLRERLGHEALHVVRK